MRPELRRSRALLATATAQLNRRPGDAEARALVAERRRDFITLSLEDHIRRVVDEAPELDAERRDRLALLLRGGERP